MMLTDEKRGMEAAILFAATLVKDSVRTIGTDISIERIENDIKRALWRALGGRCALFAGNHIPRGGARDFRAFGSVEELMALHEKHAVEWAGEEKPWGLIADARSLEPLFETDAHGQWVECKPQEPPENLS